MPAEPTGPPPRRPPPGRRLRGGAAGPAFVAAVAVVAVVALVVWVVGRPGPDRSETNRPTGPTTRPALVPTTMGPTTTEPAASATIAPGSAPTATVAPVRTTADGVVASWVRAENAKPGTSAWALGHPATDHQIEGYADHVSAAAGDRVRLFVSTTAPAYRVQAFRMGWYGGALGRLVWTSTPLRGSVQPACPVVPGVNMVQCAWRASLAVPITAGAWPPGDYLVKLEAASGWQSYVPLTVRDDSSRSAYLVNNSVTTWQAYNTYGGYDLYQGPDGALADRASIVSFDRPYVLGDGAGDFVGLELRMVSMMESLGLDVSYTTDVDLHRAPGLLLRHRAFISLGHDEYYSLAMRDGVESARDHGVNLVFLGANAIYRHIRLQPSPLGPLRQEIDYKDATKDPLLGRDDADVTPWAWRGPPNNNPESRILGGMWQCNPVRADLVVTDPGSWLFAGTGLRAGSRIPGIVGPEYDHFDPGAPNPGDVSVVARSPVVCNRRPSTADMTYYSQPGSRAGVWDTATIDWVGSVGPVGPAGEAPNAVTRITVNVLAAFGVGPAGVAHPSSATIPP